MKDFLLSPTGLGYIALGLVLLGAALKSFLPKKADTVSKIEGIAFKVFNFVEKAIPDSTGSESKVSRALQKADLFCKKFIEEYTVKNGKAPSKKELDAAVEVAEKLVYNSNKK